MLAVDVSLWLLVVGAASIAAAALYSGGPKPYASSGLGEVSVLVFFGFVATCGSAFVQLERVPWLAVGASVPVGLLACAILLVNNLRDIASDTASGKRTLAVRIGAARTVRLYQASFVGAYASLPVLAIAAPWALGAFATLPLAVRPLQHVRVTRPATAPRGLPDRHRLAAAGLLDSPGSGAGAGVTLVELRLRIPLLTPLGGLDHRLVTLVEGPAGWGECSPLPGYPCDPALARAAAEEAATVVWPPAVRRHGRRQQPRVPPSGPTRRRRWPWPAGARR